MQDGEAVQIRKHPAEYDHIRLEGRGHLERHPPGIGRGHVEAGDAERGADQKADVLLIVYDQYPRFVRSRHQAAISSDRLSSFADLGLGNEADGLSDEYLDASGQHVRRRAALAERGP